MHFRIAYCQLRMFIQKEHFISRSFDGSIPFYEDIPELQSLEPQVVTSYPLKRIGTRRVLPIMECKRKAEILVLLSPFKHADVVTGPDWNKEFMFIPTRSLYANVGAVSIDAPEDRKQELERFGQWRLASKFGLSIRLRKLHVLRNLLLMERNGFVEETSIGSSSSNSRNRRWIRLKLLLGRRRWLVTTSDDHRSFYRSLLGTKRVEGPAGVEDGTDAAEEEPQQCGGDSLKMKTMKSRFCMDDEFSSHLL
uniref:Uncharacterized protein n=1 Tax=Cannabis sativa TaxID=3483 RepID=A0A803PQ57_CANSA